MRRLGGVRAQANDDQGELEMVTSTFRRQYMTFENNSPLGR
jgi:hypothetical protein